MKVKSFFLIEVVVAILVLCNALPISAKENNNGPEVKTVVGENGAAIWDNNEVGIALEPEDSTIQEEREPLISSDASSAVETLMAMDIVTIDGFTCHVSDFSEDYVVILFGRSGCGNTRGMATTAANLRDKGASLKLVIMDVDEEDEGLPAFVTEKRAIGSLNPPYNNRTMWTLLDSENLASGSVTLPASFVLDKSRNLIYSHTGIDTNGLKAAIKNGCGGEEGGGSTISGVTAFPFKVKYGQSEARAMLSDMFSGIYKYCGQLHESEVIGCFACFSEGISA